MYASVRWAIVPLILLVVFATASRLSAQAPDAAQPGEPVAVVAFSGLDAALGDVVKLLHAVDGQADADQLQALVKRIEPGVDTKRPVGLVVFPGKGMPQPLLFVPITSLPELLDLPLLKDNLGEPKDLGGGVFQFEAPKPVFVKEHNGWAFASSQAEGLTSLPDDPVALLDGLEKEYDVAVRLYVQRMDPALRVQMLQGLQGVGIGGEVEVERIPGEGAEDPFGATGAGNPTDPFAPGEANPVDEPAEGGAADPFGAAEEEAVEDPFSGAADDPFAPPGAGDPFAGGDAGPTGPFDQFLPVLDQLDVVTIGVALDGDAANAQVEVTATVVDSSEAAPRLKALAGVMSNHAGLITTESALALHAAIGLLPDDAELLAKWFESEVPSDEDLAAQEFADDALREQAKKQHEWKKLALKLLAVTARTGKLDGGFSMIAEPKNSAFVFGGRAGDADALREVMITIVREMQEQAGIPKEQFARVDHKGYRFVIVEGIKHADLPNAPGGGESNTFGSDELFADEIDVVLALREADYYLALGNQCTERVKAIIDASEAGAAAAAAPLSVSLGTRSMIQVSDETILADGQDVTARLAAIEGPDRMLTSVVPVEGGATLRIEFQKLPLLAAVMQVQKLIHEGPPGGSAPSGNDPFGGGAVPSDDDPFGGAGTTPSDDPFGGGAAGGTPAKDPFDP